MTAPTIVSEKPLKPVFSYDGKWWAFAYSSSGWYIARRDGVDDWVAASPLITSSGAEVLTIDAHLTGNKVTWYGYHDSTPRIGRLEYNNGEWEIDTATVTPPIIISDGNAFQASTLVVDSLGRTWGFVDLDSEIQYFVLDLDLSVLQGATTLTTDPASIEHLSRSVAWDNKVGVLWDNQSSYQMKFIWRNDADGLTTWQTVEIASSENISNNADDHGDITPGPDGTLLATWKTSLSGASDPNIIAARRDTNGTWTEAVVFNRFGSAGSNEYTRPRIVYDADSDLVRVACTKTHRPGRIVGSTAPVDTLVFSPEQVLIDEDLYNVTVPHHNFTSTTGKLICAERLNGELVEWSVDPTPPVEPSELQVRIDGVWYDVLALRYNGQNVSFQQFVQGTAPALELMASVTARAHFVYNPYRQMSAEVTARATVAFQNRWPFTAAATARAVTGGGQSAKRNAASAVVASAAAQSDIFRKYELSAALLASASVAAQAARWRRVSGQATAEAQTDWRWWRPVSASRTARAFVVMDFIVESVNPSLKPMTGLAQARALASAVLRTTPVSAEPVARAIATARLSLLGANVSGSTTAKALLQGVIRVNSGELAAPHRRTIVPYEHRAIALAYEPRKMYVSLGESNMHIFRKQPADHLDYDLDLSEWLSVGDFPVGVTYELDDETIEVTGTEIAENFVKFWVRGGIDGRTYHFTVNISTQTGREKEVDFKIAVRDIK